MPGYIATQKTNGYKLDLKKKNKNKKMGIFWSKEKSLYPPLWAERFSLQFVWGEGHLCGTIQSSLSVPTPPSHAEFLAFTRLYIHKTKPSTSLKLPAPKDNQSSETYRKTSVTTSDTSGTARLSIWDKQAFSLVPNAFWTYNLKWILKLLLNKRLETPSYCHVITIF